MEHDGEAHPQAQPRGAELVERLAARLSGTTNVRSVFGQPVERDGTTVIPVASVQYGFGGGGGRKADKGEVGTGGGGGVRVSPVGFIEMSEGNVAFRRIRPSSPLMRALGIAFAASIVARGLADAVLSLRDILHRVMAPRAASRSRRGRSPRA